MPDYLDDLSLFLENTTFDDLPEAVLERARFVIADCVAAVIGGAAEPEMQRLVARMAGNGGGSSTVLGAGLRVDASKAAFLNGTAGTFLEMDEGNQFSRGHPGIHVVPAALALAEAMGRNGRDVLLAVTLGYEVGARIGMAAKIRPSMHPHGTWGTTGAAVAVAKMMRADAVQFREVINISSSLGLTTSRQTMLQGGTVRNSFSGFSGQIGLMCWDMLQAGFTGEKDGLSSVWGKVISESFTPGEMTRELGERWEITRNYFKRHACCRYNHGALDALAKVGTKRTLRADEIARVDVETYSLAVELDDQNPQNTLAGKFSLPFAIATTIIHGTSGVGSFTWEAIRRDDIQDLADRVIVREDHSLTAMMPDFRPARVVITFSDGTTATGETKTNRGDSEDPYSEAELVEKYYELASRLLTPEVAQNLHDGIMSLEDVADIRDLLRPLSSAS
ncbi:MAG: MmgE/PrpD family protein [Rhodospirillales bacterium]